MYITCKMDANALGKHLGMCPNIPVLSLYPLSPAPSQILLTTPQKWLPH